MTITSKQIHVEYHGALGSGTGYAEAARNAVLALYNTGAIVKTESAGFGKTVLTCKNGVIKCHREMTNRALELPAELISLFDHLHRNRLHVGAPLVLHAPSVRYGDFVENGRQNIGYTAWETARMPQNWVDGCNLVDEIWIPSFHNLEALRNSGVTKPIFVIPHTIDTERFTPADVRLNGRFTFVSVFRWGLRKGWPEMFTAYERAFTADDPVTLRVLTNYREESHKREAQSIIDHFAQPGKPRVEIVPLEFVAYDFVPLLYQNADAFVLPSRGEGFCMPCAEAMACGLPAIVTNATAFTDYVSESNGYPVSYQTVEADDMSDPDRASTAWCVADIDCVAGLMRRAYEYPEERIAKGERARSTIQAKFGFDMVGKMMSERLETNGG